MSTQYIRYPATGSDEDVVTSLNTQTGDLSLVAGTGVTITPGSGTLTISAPGGGAGVSDVTATAPLLSSGGSTPDISIPVATSLVDGYLSSTDWSTFNGKQGAGNYLTALTGDATAAGPGSAALTLATVNSNTGTFGSATATGTFTVNGKGLITAASATPIQITESQVTNLVSDLAGKQATGNYITALTGDVTAAGPGSSAATLATVNSNVGSFGSSTSIPSFTVNAKGLVTAASGNVVVAPAGTLSGTTLNATVVTSSLTAVGTLTTGTWSASTIAIAKGGTGQTTKTEGFDALAPTTTKGDVIAHDGADNVRVAVGTNGYVLTADSGASSGVSWQPSGSTAPIVLAVSLSLTSIFTAGNIIVWDTVDIDTNSGFNTGSGEYTIPVTGYYDIETGGVSALNPGSFYADANGANVGYISTISTTGINSGGRTFAFNAGDVVSIKTDSTLTLVGSNQSFFTLFLIK